MNDNENVTGQAERLLELQQLEPGWLWGDEGDLISDESIRVARDVVDDCIAAGFTAPAIFPTEDGQVRLEWTGDGENFNSYWEATIGNADEVDVFWLHNHYPSTLTHSSAERTVNSDGVVAFFTEMTESAANASTVS